MNEKALLMRMAALSVAVTVAPGASGQADKVPADSGSTYRMLKLPKVRVEPRLLDFGDVRPGKEVSKDVQVFNESEVPIRIVDTLSTCRCTVAEYPTEAIAPGEAATLTIRLDTGELTGQVTRYIQVQFEGGARPIAIGARAYVSEGIRADIRYARPDRDDLFLLDLVEPEGTPFRVVSVSGAAPVYVDAETSADEAYAEHHLRIERAADEKRMWIAVETDHPDAPLVVIAADADAIGDMTVRPTWIFGEQRFMERGMVPGEPRELVVNLRGIGAKERDDITSVHVLDDRVQAQVMRGEGDGPFALNLHVALTPRPEVHGLVHTMIEISARGFVQAVDLIMLVDGEVSEPASASTEEGAGGVAADTAADVEDALADEPSEIAPVPVEDSDAAPIEQPEQAPVEDKPELEEDDGWAPITPPARGASRS